MMNCAPILLFVYNRPEHTQRCIESLKRNSLATDSTLYIYADGAKDDTQQPAVNEVRSYIHTIRGFKETIIIERDENWGLARNIIDGVTTQVNQYGRVIVLEDDLVVAPYFLQFMNDALETYQDEPKVGHIQACDFTQDSSLPIPSSSNGQAVGDGLHGTEHGNISIPTERNCYKSLNNGS